MSTIFVTSDTDLSSTILPGVTGFTLFGVQVILSASQFDGIQISQQVNFASVSPDVYNEVYVTIGDGHLIDARQWTFTNWGFSAIEDAGNHTFLDGSTGDDVIFGSSENDWIFSNGGNDIIRAGAGNDFVGFFSGRGNTTVNGGGGVDLANFSLAESTENLDIDIASGGGRRDIGNGTKVAGFERLFFYSGSGDDRIGGGGLDDRLVGNAGNDVLLGRDGADWLYGGDGADNLIGGAGADRFDYFFLSESNRIDGVDRIRKVEAGDRILLNAINGEGWDAFTYIGDQAFSGTAGELRVFLRGDKWIVAGDTDGDMISDLTIIVTNTANLTEANFLL